MKKNIIKLIIIFVVVFAIGYKGVNLIFNEGYKQGFSTATEKSKENTKFDLAPQCLMGNCPEYDSFDTDGDNVYEDVVLEHTAMTQQAGRIWIIDKGQVVFISDDKAQISVSPRGIKDKEETGFTILYATESPMSGEEVFKNSFKVDYFQYKDGEYVLEKTVDNPMN